MVLWGGLRPIASRAVLDGLTLTVWAWGTLVGNNNDNNDNNDNNKKKQSYLCMLLASVVSMVAAGNVTNRWTLTLPMVPLLLLQGLTRLLVVPSKTRNQKQQQQKQQQQEEARFYLFFDFSRLFCDVHVWLTLLSWMCIVVAIALCLAFPAVELPPVDGPYHVGKVDLFLPMNNNDNNYNNDNNHSNPQGNSRAVWVRLLYPTLEKPQAWPYLTTATAIDYCTHSMNMGAPPALQSFDWILHTWRLTQRWETPGASLLAPTTTTATTTTTTSSGTMANPAALPVIVFSHGLGGHADIYSYQTHSLAAAGNVVLTITHADGSSPVVNQADGSIIEYDYQPQEIAKQQGYSQQVIEMRRNQTEWRVQEVLAATQALARWNANDIQSDLPADALHSSLSLKGRLNLQQVTWMGHSFGGATVLTAAHRYPDLVHTVIAHEPAMDWAHPAVLSSLFAQSRIANLTLAYTFDKTPNPSPHDDDSLHRAAHVLLLFSHEWVTKGWAYIPLLQDMQQHGRLGSSYNNNKNKQTIFSFDYVPGMHHNEFSDTGMLTPTWLARAVGLTGSRNPIDTAKDVAARTRSFLQQCRRYSPDSSTGN